MDSRHRNSLTSSLLNSESDKSSQNSTEQNEGPATQLTNGLSAASIKSRLQSNLIHTKSSYCEEF